MARDVETVLNELLRQGISLTELIAAGEARLARGAEDDGEEEGVADPHLADTILGLEARESDVRFAISLPHTRRLAQRLARIDGLPRYDDLGLLGIGGMGEVRRVRDRRLGRILALKTLHAPAMNRPELIARFVEEAQATAQLQHPNIVPVYDLGELPDGRLWFTMKEVSGQTLSTVIAEVHAVSHRRWHAAPSGWTLRRLVDAMRLVCEAVGYAHSRGVVHRDLKPSNVMVGNRGEVQVLDWGLVKILGRPDRAVGVEEPAPVESSRSLDTEQRTQVGVVAGTPAYMAPEQAYGRSDEMDARCDVYSLGAMLYEILSGRPPYLGNRARTVLEQVRYGPPAVLSVPARSGLERPPALVGACERAMARDAAQRYASAAELADELQAWLDGDRRVQEGRAVVVRAKARQPEADVLRVRATALQKAAASMLEGLEDWRPESDKVSAWQKEDEATRLEKRAELHELEQEQLLQASLTHAPDLPEAHAALAALYRIKHESSEAARKDTTRHEALFRQHLDALPEDHPDRVDHLAWLQGDGALSLVTDPPGAEVLLYRYVLHNRRLVPRFERSLGTTPLRETSLQMGSYLCVLRHPGRVDVQYPVSIGRREHWHGVPPEGGECHPIPLPRLDELGPEDHYVPAGWYTCGGDVQQDRSLPFQRVWVDGRVFRRFPVTNRQFIEFLDDLVARGRTEEALAHAARERSAVSEEKGALIYGFDGSRFFLRPDADGDLWNLQMPVCMVNWNGAMAFGAWESLRTGQLWRLPGELAWEKAARGVDGRTLPWGDAFDPTWACTRRSHRGRPMPVSVGSFPVDESCYGIRDLAGGVLDWCLDTFHSIGPPLASARASGPAVGGALVTADGPAAADGGALRAIRGGTWFSPQELIRVGLRDRILLHYRDNRLGFRLARSYP